MRAAAALMLQRCRIMEGEVDYSPAPVIEYDKAIQNPETNRRHSQEVE
jgi:hypothetical protein